MKKLKIIFDMEMFSDIDDWLTLLFLANHPCVELVAVTICPGTAAEVGFVRAALGWFGLSIPVGVRDLDCERHRIRPWHYDVYGDLPPSRDAEPAAALLYRVSDDDTTLVTGGSLTNVADAIRLSSGQFKAGRLVAMGGFAGDGMDKQALPEFAGVQVYKEYNFGLDPEAGERTLAYNGIAEKYVVSKNVTHAAIYDSALHETFAALKGQSRFAYEIWRFLDLHLEDYIQRKAHQPTKPNKRTATINEAIRAEQIQLIGSMGEQFGLVGLNDAIARASMAGLSLVKIGPAAKHPLCKIMDAPQEKPAPAPKPLGKRSTISSRPAAPSIRRSRNGPRSKCIAKTTKNGVLGYRPARESGSRRTSTEKSFCAL